MGRHTRTTAPTPTGMKVFGGLLGVLLIAAAGLGIGSAMDGDDKTSPDSKPTATVSQKTTPSPTPTPGKVRPTPSKTTFLTCEEAKAAGALPLKRGEPGYLDQFDMDQDGVACEGV